MMNKLHTLVLMSALLFLLSAGLGAFGQGPDDASTNYSATMLNEPLNTITEPGLLSNAHKDLEGIENCTKCHPTADSPGRSKCFNCHAEIRERWEKSVGYHGTYLKGNCVECHGEHNGIESNIVEFDTLMFNHNLAAFPLEGQHRRLDCEKCHLMRSGETGVLSPRYIGLSTECYQCHTTPHGGEVDIQCQACHTQQGWTGRTVIFNHNRDAAFPLRGAHVDTACEACHPDKVFKPRPTDCAGCHEDPHQGLLGTGCTQCHSEWKWGDARFTFNHDVLTSFPLIGAHRELACNKCHSVQYKGIPTQCAACHTDRHEGKWGNTCEECHNQWKWADVDLKRFNHNTRTGFLLKGKHATLECAECHTGKSVLDEVGIECLTCHADDYHQGELGEKCERCHSPETWSIPAERFNHTAMTGYETGRIHANLDCTACHGQEKRFTGAAPTCVGCHEDIQVFVQGMSIFDDLTTMPSAMLAHKTCSDCHSPGDSPGDVDTITQRCVLCHPDSYGTLSEYRIALLKNRSGKIRDMASHLNDFISRRRSEVKELPAAAAINVDAFSEKLLIAKKVLNRIRVLGYHNFPLALEELDRAEKILEDFRDTVLIHTSRAENHESEQQK